MAKKQEANYHEFVELPAWTRPVWKGEKVVNAADPYKWSGSGDPPAIGVKLKTYLNNLGEGTVLGYFAEYGWLGCKVRLHKPPKWWVEQNKVNGRTTNPAAHLFGIDLEPRKMSNEEKSNVR